MNLEAIDAQFLVRYQGFDLDVNLSLPGRGVTAIFGRSGSGKTTFLRCMAGLERSASGRLSVQGKVWQDDNLFLPTHKRPIGFVFQEPSLFPHLNVKKNLKYAFKRSDFSTDPISYDHVITLLGIEHLLGRFPNKLSGGEKQRVAIARALLVNPRILFMDEPLASLDLTLKQEILPYLEQIKMELDIPIFYVSHSLDEITRLADHIVILEKGKALTSGSINETLSCLDVPIKLGEDISVILEASVIDFHQEWKLMKLGFSGGELWLPKSDAKIGQLVRVRILAKDISLTLNRHNDTSILNLLQGEIFEIIPDSQEGLVLVRARVGSSEFIARVTRRSVSYLDLQPNKKVWLQIKSAALV